MHDIHGTLPFERSSKDVPHTVKVGVQNSKPTQVESAITEMLNIIILYVCEDRYIHEDPLPLQCADAHV